MVNGRSIRVHGESKPENIKWGEDGADLYRLFFIHLPGLLKDGGSIGFEIAGDDQAKILLSIAPSNFVLTNRIFDYNGILRHLTWKKN